MKDFVHSVAGRYGLDIVEDGSLVRLSRGEATASFATRWRDDFAGRHAFHCVCVGTRLGLDRLTHRYDFSTERPTGADARNVYEMSSVYGERLQQLVPKAALDIAEAIAGIRAVEQTWVDGVEARLAFVRETARHFHLLAESDLDELPYTRANIVEYARYALFYDAYKFKPEREEKSDIGRMRWYRTTNGQAASRATLLPDFDLDAARARGAAAVVDRDLFIVVEPSNSGDTNRALAWLRRAAREAAGESRMPLSRRLVHLTPRRTVAGATFDGHAKLDSAHVVDALDDVSTPGLREAT